MTTARLVDTTVSRPPCAGAPGQLPPALALRRVLRTVHDVIDRRLVHVRFEPVVQPRTGDVVALEAHVVGAEGTPFEAAWVLRHAAVAVGRLGELDWIGRSAAAHALAAHDIDPSIAVLFEADGRGLYQPCPYDCVAAVDRLLRRRRCIVRLDPGHSSTLAHAMVAGTDQLRAAGFEIALEGPPMGVASGSMLRCFEPELVTVDARALVTLVHRDGPQAVPALGEFYRRTGRQLVVRHVEDRDGAHQARVIGAAFAQGPHLGGATALGQTRL